MRQAGRKIQSEEGGRMAAEISWAKAPPPRHAYAARDAIYGLRVGG